MSYRNLVMLGVFIVIYTSSSHAEVLTSDDDHPLKIKTSSQEDAFTPQIRKGVAIKSDLESDGEQSGKPDESLEKARPRRSSRMKDPKSDSSKKRPVEIEMQVLRSRDDASAKSIPGSVERPWKKADKDEVYHDRDRIRSKISNVDSRPLLTKKGSPAPKVETDTTESEILVPKKGLKQSFKELFSRKKVDHAPKANSKEIISEESQLSANKENEGEKVRDLDVTASKKLSRKSYSEKEVLAFFKERQRLMDQFDEGEREAVARFIVPVENIEKKLRESASSSEDQVVGPNRKLSEAIRGHHELEEELHKLPWYRRLLSNESKTLRESLSVQKQAISALKKDPTDWNRFADLLQRDNKVLKYFSDNQEVKDIRRVISFTKNPDKFASYLRGNLCEEVSKPRNLLSRLFKGKKFDSRKLELNLRNRTPLMIAAGLSDVSPSIFQELANKLGPYDRDEETKKQYHDEIKKTDDFGFTALDYAIKAKNSDAVSWILNHYSEKRYPITSAVEHKTGNEASPEEVKKFIDKEKEVFGVSDYDVSQLAKIEGIFERHWSPAMTPKASQPIQNEVKPKVEKISEEILRRSDTELGSKNEASTESKKTDNEAGRIYRSPKDMQSFRSKLDSVPEEEVLPQDDGMESKKPKSLPMSLKRVRPQSAPKMRVVEEKNPLDSDDAARMKLALKKGLSQNERKDFNGWVLSGGTEDIYNPKLADNPKYESVFEVAFKNYDEKAIVSHLLPKMRNRDIATAVAHTLKRLYNSDSIDRKALAHLVNLAIKERASLPMETASDQDFFIKEIQKRTGDNISTISTDKLKEIAPVSVDY